MRIFNTTGPVWADEHYYLPPLERFDLDDILFLIEQKKYFVLHAPRQVGKTSYLLALMDYLNGTGDYHCLYLNVESAQAAREDVEAAMRMILIELATRAEERLSDSYPREIMDDIIADAGNSALNVLISQWAQASDKPLVLFVDEVDALIGDTLISVLRQLRSGYDKRPTNFPQSIILCGVRDVRDYRIHSSQTKEVITGGSAFNIKAESLRLGNFQQTEVEELYRQHTAETGQEFTPESLSLIWELTEGQPWLANALGYEVCFRTKVARQNRETITAEVIHQAKEAIIRRRVTHLHQLTDKLKEEQVQKVMEPIVSGTELDGTVHEDDIQYAIDLGLIYRSHQGLQVANAIYREIIPRELNYITQLNLESQIQPSWYIASDGRIDMDKLMVEFQTFFRQNAEHWIERFDYKEAGPQLLLQAFLQRIVNGGGRIEREYGLGRGRTDLLIVWPYGDQGAVQRVVIETKLKHGHLTRVVIPQGLAQTWAYMDRCDTQEGHLVIFDRSKNRSWEKKIFRRAKQHNNTEIIVWGM